MKSVLSSILIIMSFSSAAFASINDDCIERLMSSGMGENVAAESCRYAQVEPSCIDKKTLAGANQDTAVNSCLSEIPESNFVHTSGEFEKTAEEHKNDIKAWDTISTSALVIALGVVQYTAGREGWTVGQKFSMDKMGHFAGNTAIVMVSDALFRRADIGLSLAFIASATRGVYKNLHAGMHCEIMSLIYDSVGIALGNFLGRNLIILLDENNRPQLGISVND